VWDGRYEQCGGRRGCRRLFFFFWPVRLIGHYVFRVNRKGGDCELSDVRRRLNGSISGDDISSVVPVDIHLRDSTGDHQLLSYPGAASPERPAWLNAMVSVAIAVGGRRLFPGVLAILALRREALHLHGQLTLRMKTRCPLLSHKGDASLLLETK